MKTMVCPECGREVDIEDEVKRKHCLIDGYLMRAKG